MKGRLKQAREKKELRSGITTGACAAGAAHAAARLLFNGETISNALVFNPQGLSIEVRVKSVALTGGGARAVVVKDAGDDPDVTHGMDIVANVAPVAGGLITLKGGAGVGVVTRPGLQVPVGEPAINPVPAKMIKDALYRVIPPGEGVEVTISVPGGEEIAHRTLNPRLGIVGGISILGTTGIVRPMSEEAFKDSLVPLVSQAVAQGHRTLLLTPGRMGQRQAVEGHGFNPDMVVEMSNFVGFMLDCCSSYGVEQVLLWGHIGKLAKVAGGIFHTHSKVADARREIIAAHAAQKGAGRELVEKIMQANTLEGVVEHIEKEGFGTLFSLLAEKASLKAEERVRGTIKTGTVILAMDGRILGLDQAARDIGRALGCTKLP